MPEYTRREFLKLVGSGLATAALGSIPDLNATGKQGTKMRIAYPPTVEALPLTIGKEGNIFRDKNIQMKFVTANSYSDAARLTAQGNVHGCITDLTGVILAYTNSGQNLAITSAGITQQDKGQYTGLVRSSYWNISSVSELVNNWLNKGPKHSIALNLGSDLHYCTDQLLRSSGFTPKPQKYYILAERLVQTMLSLLNGTFIAAVLPEPLLTLATSNPYFEGSQARLITDYSSISMPPAVLAFRRPYLRDYFNVESGLMDRFYTSWKESIKAANQASKQELLQSALQVLSSTMPGFGGILSRYNPSKEFETIFSLPSFIPPHELNSKPYRAVGEWINQNQWIQRSRFESQVPPLKKIISSTYPEYAK